MAVEIMDVPPELAAEWVATNAEHQRALSGPRVTQYKAIMQNGGWLATGESLIFDQEGMLLNGQHRLTASAAINFTLKKQVVVTGVEREAFRAMDTGAMRVAADVLTIAGHGGGGPRFTKPMATAATMGILYARGNAPSSLGGTRFALDGRLASTVVTHMDVLAFVEKNGTIKNSTKVVMDLQGTKKSLLRSSFLIWAHYQGRKIDTALADDLVAAINSGASLRAGDPFHVLRELLIVEQTARRKQNKSDMLAGIVKCWNAKRAGEKITKPGTVFKHDWEKFPRFK